MKIKILTFVSYYLPGYKAGGPLRTISNMTDHLADDFEFWIVTRDRDLGDREAYTDVPLNQWVTVDGAHVLYCSPDQQTMAGLVQVINETPYDILYLNSFFDVEFTFKPLLAQSWGRLPEKPIVLAPRGEFSVGALKLKSLKKKIYIFVSRLFCGYKNIIWHASSEHEAEDIKRLFPKRNDNILIAMDLPVKENTGLDGINHPDVASGNSDAIHIIFLSRISPKKNLDFALRILRNVKCDVIFDIYGPIENADYWKVCQTLIDLLPHNVQVNYCGTVMPDDVASIFSRYDLFLFPTHGENYGHVIAEALSVGTPVLLSDQTPWKNLDVDGLGWDLPLDDMDSFVDIVESYALKNEDEKTKCRTHIQSKVVDRLTDPKVLEANRQLFYKCLSR